MGFLLFAFVISACLHTISRSARTHGGPGSKDSVFHVEIHTGAKSIDSAQLRQLEGQERKASVADDIADPKIADCPEECSECCALPVWWTFNSYASRTHFKCIVHEGDPAPFGSRTCDAMTRRASTYKQMKTTCEFTDDEYYAGDGGKLPWCGTQTIYPRKSHENSKFDLDEAKLMAKMVNAAYYALNITKGTSAQWCIDSGFLKMPPNVTAKVIGQFSTIVRETNIGVTVATVSVNGAPPDVWVMHPGTAGSRDSKGYSHKMSQLVAQVASFVFEDYVQLPEITGPTAPTAGALGYFAEAFKACWPDVLRLVKSVPAGTSGRIVVGGHSLGGAIAAITAAHLGAELHLQSKPVLYSFGQPRTGNFGFAQAVDRLVQAWRIVNGGDPVPHVPPCDFTSQGCNQGKDSSRLHHGTEIWFPDGTDEDNFWECPTREDNACSNSVMVDSHSHSYYFGTTRTNTCDPDLIKKNAAAKAAAKGRIQSRLSHWTCAWIFLVFALVGQAA